jgi:hypothetical protein
MLLAAGFALAPAHLTGIHPGTATLAASPDGIAEMSLTAPVLHLGVPIVTAFHVSRMALCDIKRNRGCSLTVSPDATWRTSIAAVLLLGKTLYPSPAGCCSLV